VTIPLAASTDTTPTRWPWSTSAHGPLPVLLLLLSVVTGLVDAVSYLALGHVFVANMTGNVVFLGFALAGAPGLSAPASLAALAAFLLGALLDLLIPLAIATTLMATTALAAHRLSTSDAAWARPPEAR
jgi:uncharacterized membrane protein YoaK (UPF0700 family)